MNLFYRPPLHEVDFQRLCLLILKAQYPDRSLTARGKSGHKQHGVDIEDLSGVRPRLAWQCKLRNGRDGLTPTDIADATNKALIGGLSIDRLCILTTADGPTRTNDAVKTLNVDLQSTHQFQVHLVWWDEIHTFLMTHPEIAASHYGAIHPSEARNLGRRLSCHNSIIVILLLAALALLGALFTRSLNDRRDRAIVGQALADNVNSYAITRPAKSIDSDMRPPDRTLDHMHADTAFASVPSSLRDRLPKIVEQAADPRSQDVLSRGTAHFARGEYLEAAACFSEEAARAGKRAVDLYNMQAQSLLAAGDYAGAVGVFERALSLSGPSTSASSTLRMRFGLAKALDDSADHLPEPTRTVMINRAIIEYGLASAIAHDNSLERARINNNISRLKMSLARSSDTTLQAVLYADAIGLLRLSLKALTGNAGRIDVAIVTDNLGNALALQSESLPSEIAVANLSESESCHRRAMDLWQPNEYTVQWARAAGNLATCLMRQLGHTSDTTTRLALIEEALHISERCRSLLADGHDVYGWSVVQSNASVALEAYSELTSGDFSIELLYDAKARLESVLSILSSDLYSDLWADASNNLGVVLRRLALEDKSVPRQERIALLLRSVGLYQDALSVRHPSSRSPRWRETEGNLGNSLLDIGYTYKGRYGTGLIVEAIARLRLAQGTCAEDQRDAVWARRQEMLFAYLWKLADLIEVPFQVSVLEEAHEELRLALVVWKSIGTTVDVKRASGVLDGVTSRIQAAAHR